ncbi:SPOR domain-containing protein [Thalassolituus sp. LLYu03]|uniref:SPOR domain-containing protein n=1 Tax=Thalassolituus sp. LLYu03 TaxID=3421656 RepID=UPI003D2B07A9
MSDSSSHIPKWVWITTPTLAVAFIGFILFLSTIPSGDELDAVKGDARKVLQQGVEKAKEETARQVDKQSYEFYKLLEKQTVEVPEVDAYHSTPKDNETYQYRLQAGSFRNAEDAERMRASLLLEGLTAYRQESTVNGTTWHRVFVGPFTDRSKMNKAQDILAERSISPLVVKEPLKK